MMKIDFAKLQYQYQLYKSDIDKKIQDVLNKSNYIMGEEVQQLENELELYTGAKHAITCSNGPDALTRAMIALNIEPGDEIITTPFTFIATAETIALLKAKPVFVDIDPETYNIDTKKIEERLTTKTKAIIAVSLYGQPSDMEEINLVANKYGIKVIIDGAQCFGSTYNNKPTSKFSDIYTTSFFPAKPLGCYGDGGAIFTDNDEYAEKIRMIRVHGQNKRYNHKYLGITGRLDTIQAAVLLAKIPHYKKEVDLRNTVAEKYNKKLRDIVKTPVVKANRRSVWAQYTIRVNSRDMLQTRLQECGIPTSVHYPIPLHLQECFKYLGLNKGQFPNSENAAEEVISLPMNPFVTDEEIEYIANCIKNTV